MRRAQIKKTQNGVSPLSYHASMQPRLFCTLACSRRSDSGDRAKRCEQKKKKQRRGGVRGESEVSFLFPSPLFLLIFLPLSYLVPHFTIGTPETGYPFAECVKSQYNRLQLRAHMPHVHLSLTIIPRAWMGSESIAHEAEGRICYWLRSHQGERNNCFSKTQVFGQKYLE